MTAPAATVSVRCKPALAGTARAGRVPLSVIPQPPKSFNAWLRRQLKEKQMSQRQLALQSGVDHSTISRLIKGERTPSLGTATRLARGLREISRDEDSPIYFDTIANRHVLPTMRVEYALRGDDLLHETDVRQLMQAYIQVRTRRQRANQERNAG